jgi:hypothetical protein
MATDSQVTEGKAYIRLHLGVYAGGAFQLGVSLQKLTCSWLHSLPCVQNTRHISAQG